ncbi:MAG TPA: endonuclease/exonuclease/phosphatase family protein [Chloroflexota bacterium]|nr:endonuclease/exonuclease/phosphatase family protein [Chloroflexota bacterium]
METISFLSGNLRGWATAEQDGENAWESRAPLYAALLRERLPNLIGFQEFHAHNLRDLQPALPFHAYSLGRESDSKSYVPVFWDSRRFEPVDQGAFWLNKWQDRKALGWDANNERSMTWVELADNEDGCRLLFINTHLDHVGEIARTRGAQLILDFLEDWPPELPVIITGDFNASPYHPRRQVPYNARTFGLFAEAGFMDAFRCATGIWPPPATFHNYEGDAYRPDQFGTWYIDWPLVRNLRVVSAQVVRHHQGEKPLSDHYPVHAVVTYTNAS